MSVSFRFGGSKWNERCLGQRSKPSAKIQVCTCFSDSWSDPSRIDLCFVIKGLSVDLVIDYLVPGTRGHSIISNCLDSFLAYSQAIQTLVKAILICAWKGPRSANCNKWVQQRRRIQQQPICHLRILQYFLCSYSTPMKLCNMILLVNQSTVDMFCKY